MVRIVLDAGHGLMTPGKQTPDGEKEWTFNNAVLLAAKAELETYQHVELLRVDDPSGKTDVSLKTRTDRANAWKADAYLSFHHNANTGNWGDWGGVETFTMDAVNANPTSIAIAKMIQPGVVAAMGLRDRGVKKQNLHVLRETKMPAVLIEGGFMDSRTDIDALRDPERLKAQGKAVGEAIAAYYNLQKKKASAHTAPTLGKPAAGEPVPGKRYRLATGTFPTRAAAETAAATLSKQHGWTVYIKEE